MLDITKCFSILVASGSGHRCNDLRNLLHQELLKVNKATGKYNLVLLKHGRKSFPEEYTKVSRRMASKVSPLFSDVDDKFFSIDLKKDKR